MAKEYSLYDRLEFGKYRGKTVKQVIRDDPDYLVWCLDNVDGFFLDEEAEVQLDLALEW